MIAIPPIPSAGALSPPPPDPHLESIRRLCGEIEGLAASAAQAPPPAAEAVSFGIFTAPLEVFTAIRTTVARLLGEMRPTATIRTVLDSGESATTVVTYTGLAASVWPVDPSADLAATQLTSLQHVFTVRSALARAVVAAGGALAALSATAANPLALPHVISTARSLLDALQRLAAAAQTT